MKPVNPVGSSDVLGGSVCNESHLPSRPAYVCLVQVKLNLAKQLLRLDVLRLRVYIMLLKCGLQIRRLFFKCRYFVFECRYCFWSSFIMCCFVICVMVTKISAV